MGRGNCHCQSLTAPVRPLRRGVDGGHPDDSYGPIVSKLYIHFVRTFVCSLLVVAACGKDVTETIDAAPQIDADISAVKISGSITADATWSGAIDLTGPATIESGVTITVSAGTTITARSGSSITIKGTLDVEGTSPAHVVMKPATLNWAGLIVAGTLTMHYVEEISGGIVVNAGTVTVFDTTMAHSHNLQDYLIMNGGMIDVEYSSIVPAEGTSDAIHCDMHANPGQTLSIKVVHTNLSGAMFGIDLFGGTSDLTYNNWFSNSDDVYTEAGSPVTADLSFGWFEHGAPTAAPGSSLTANSLSPTRLTDAGPRP